MSHVKLAQKYIEIEKQAVRELMHRLNDARVAQAFDLAVKRITECQGKVVFCGIGKSGHVGVKLSSTFSSIGIPSVFLHPSEGVHGDLGLLDSKDVVIFISYSGETKELAIPLQFATRKSIPIIAMTGGLESSLARCAQIVLDVSVSKEACPFNLAPTASTTTAMVLGDALGLVCAEEKGYSPEKFAEIHPAGNLGLRLTKVRDVMMGLDQVPKALENDSIKSLLSKMTHGSVRGMAAILNRSGKLVGVVSDGDLRRYLERDQIDLMVEVKTMMTLQPKTIAEDALIEEALVMMERGKIRFLMATDSAGELKGLIEINAILRGKWV
jgi:arabinose-5-phosphate isomerase